jgi:putative endonuclease
LIFMPWQRASAPGKVVPMTTDIKPAHLVTGARGEALAARYLEEHGYVILSKNWRCPDGELDIVATDRRILIICEVKTRTSDNYGSPAEAVDNAKASRIRRLAHRWCLRNGVANVTIRHDIIAIVWPPDGEPRINHLRGVL